jgi:hypothetical protein
LGKQQGRPSGRLDVGGEGDTQEQAGAAQAALDGGQAQAQQAAHRGVGQPVHVGQHEHVAVQTRQAGDGPLHQRPRLPVHRRPLRAAAARAGGAHRRAFGQAVQGGVRLALAADGAGAAVGQGGVDGHAI